MKKFKKYFTRSASLFYADVWGRGDLEGLSEYFSSILFCFEPDRPMTIWFIPEEFSKCDRGTQNKASKSSYTKRIADRFLKNYKKIIQFIEGRIAIKGLSDLKKFYNLWVKNWPLLAIIFVIPNLETLEESKKIALEARKRTEKYSDGLRELFSKYISEYHPHLKKYAGVILPEEIFENKIDLSKLEKRLKNKFYYYNSRIYFEEQFNRLGVKFIEEQIEKNQDIVGLCAYPGKTKGRIRIINDSYDLKKIKKNEIIVANMTSPTFTPYLNLVSAIITDEGGITCHAAIIAREIKKPCVIGTKIATKVLKDGDYIEVDANKGVVRKLK